MSEIKLAKCPFCNGEAHIEEHKFWDEKAKGFTVQTYGVVCDNCCSMSWQHHRHKEKAIEQWNKRRPIERIVERLEKASVSEPLTENGVKVGTVKILPFGIATQIVKEEGGLNESN